VDHEFTGLENILEREQDVSAEATGIRASTPRVPFRNARHQYYCLFRFASFGCHHVVNTGQSCRIFTRRIRGGHFSNYADPSIGYYALRLPTWSIHTRRVSWMLLIPSSSPLRQLQMTTKLPAYKHKKICQRNVVRDLDQRQKVSAVR